MDPTTIALLVTTGASLIVNVATLLHQARVHSTLCWGGCDTDIDIENNPPSTTNQPATAATPLTKSVYRL